VSMQDSNVAQPHKTSSKTCTSLSWCLQKLNLCQSSSPSWVHRTAMVL
jgi:hypothetical protein